MAITSYVLVSECRLFYALHHLRDVGVHSCWETFSFHGIVWTCALVHHIIWTTSVTAVFATEFLAPIVVMTDNGRGL